MEGRDERVYLDTKFQRGNWGKSRTNGQNVRYILQRVIMAYFLYKRITILRKRCRKMLNDIHMLRI